MIGTAPPTFSSGEALDPQHPVVSGTFYLDTADAKLTGEAWGDKVNQVHNASDVNGDGFADIVIGAPREGEDNSGAAYLLFGGGP